MGEGPNLQKSYLSERTGKQRERYSLTRELRFDAAHRAVKSRGALRGGSGTNRKSGERVGEGREGHWGGKRGVEVARAAATPRFGVFSDGSIGDERRGKNRLSYPRRSDRAP